MLRNATNPPRRRSAAWCDLEAGKQEDNFVADVFDNFALLWDASSGDERWCEHGALSLGVLKTARGRSRLIPSAYKRELVIESRNHIGRGAKTPRQLLVGMSAAEKKGPRVRLTLKQRKAAKSQGAAKATVESKHAGLSVAYQFEKEEQLNYFYDSRRHVRFFVCLSVLRGNTYAAKSQAQRKQALRRKGRASKQSGKLAAVSSTGRYAWTAPMSVPRNI